MFYKIKSIMSVTDFSNTIPRRIRLDLNTEAELSIREAVNKIEAIGADVKLTDAINKIWDGFELVADYVDSKINVGL